MSRMQGEISYPGLPYPGPESRYEDWQNYYTYVIRPHLAYLEWHDVFLAVQYICTSFLLFFSKFTEEFLMTKQARIENILQQALSLQEEIQNAFNKQSDDEDEGAAEKALDCKRDIEALLDDNGPKKSGLFTDEFIKTVKDQFPDIFCGKKEKGELAKAWHNLWMGDDTEEDPDTKDDPKKGGRRPTKTDSIQPVSNALSAVASDFSSQSSIVQSHLKLYEANDEQWQSMAHNMMKAYVDVERQSISLQHSG